MQPLFSLSADSREDDDRIMTIVMLMIPTDCSFPYFAVSDFKKSQDIERSKFKKEV